MKNYCNGIKKRGYWKGWRCGATGTHFYDGKWYCKNHHPLMEKTPTSDNKDCAVPQSEIASPKSDKSDFAQS